MRKRLIAVALTLAAALVFKLWPQADAATEVPPPAPPPRVEASPIPDVQPLLADLALPSSNSRGRDLFRYREAPPAPPVAAEQPQVVQAVLPPAPEPVAIEAPQAPSLPPFRYRYIGRFGPDAAPIAVFRAEDAVINATVGQVIDGTWVVRAVGMESVSLALASDEARAEALRVTFGE